MALTATQGTQLNKLNNGNSFNQICFQDVPDSCITIHHLATLVDGLNGYLPEQTQQPVEAALSELRDALDYDGAKIKHLQLLSICLKMLSTLS